MARKRGSTARDWIRIAAPMDWPAPYSRWMPGRLRTLVRPAVHVARFEQAVGDQIAAAATVRATVRGEYRVSGGEQKRSLAEDPHTRIADAVEQNHRCAIRVIGLQ